MPDNAAEEGEFFGRCMARTILSVHFYRRGVWDIQHHHIRLLLADLQAYLLYKHGETGGFPLHVLMSV